MIALGVFVLMSENKIKVVETKQTINQLWIHSFIQMEGVKDMSLKTSNFF